MLPNCHSLCLAFVRDTIEGNKPGRRPHDALINCWTTCSALFLQSTRHSKGRSPIVSMVEGTRSVAQLIFLNWILAERWDLQEPIHQKYGRMLSRLSSNAQNAPCSIHPSGHLHRDGGRTEGKSQGNTTARTTIVFLQIPVEPTSLPLSMASIEIPPHDLSQRRAATLLNVPGRFICVCRFDGRIRTGEDSVEVEQKIRRASNRSHPYWAMLAA